MNRIILVIAAHTDDEALGCGGTIARHAAEGDTVHAIFLADGVSSRPTADDTDFMRRTQAAEKAHQVLGISSVRYLGLPDNRLDSLPLLDIVQQLEVAIRELGPEVIYTHHYGDLNVDHRVAHQAVMTACRPLPDSAVREIYTFEVMSSTDWSSHGAAPFMPQFYVDITNYMDRKLEALESYQFEMREAPHSRCIEHINALAMHNGHSVGFGRAEAFMIMRILR